MAVTTEQWNSLLEKAGPEKFKEAIDKHNEISGYLDTPGKKQD